ncbi:DNA internalization-related competence protein ComEC/Rec2 [Lactococcus hodotermopsidis]|uniref:DNA internalization-related competence protein ComEC/Rec2 n=2 Tax=Pseudolactococcus hodotermopsidis TaxID=2709157 RepID=A0A6A0BA66_9LACT|nr:DNA internalization-related competence protein ComEC/Rec2 [Lactococcus hodotermopsidis]
MLVFIWQNGLNSFAKLSVILVIFASLFAGVSYQEKQAVTHEIAVPKIRPILDTVQVNGDSLSLRGQFGGRTYQVYYTLQTQEEQQYFKTLDKNVTLYISASQEIAVGQRNFNGFDYQTYLKTQDIYRVLTIDSLDKITENKFFDLHLLRRQAILFCEQKFPKPMSAYMTGLLFGYLGKDFDEMGDIYTSLGIMHLFALSGMQVSFFVDFLRKMLLKIGVRRDNVDWLQIPFSVIYAGVTGFSVSVIRALIQKILANFGVKNLDNFSLTLLILFLFMPKFLLTTGGSLSILFAFVISMFGDKFESLSKMKRIFAESLVLSFSVLPLLMLYFHSFQPLSILFTFVFSFLFDVLFLPSLSVLFLLAMVTGIKITSINFIFNWLESLIKLTDRWFHYPFIFGKPQALVFLLMLLLIGFLIDYWSRKKFRYIFLTSLAVLFFITKHPPSQTITIVDIGQGDSIFLQDRFNKRNILIDTGGRVSFGESEGWKKRSTTPNAENTLIPYLKSQGVGEIDTLVITHTDEDHMGDLLAVMNQIKVKKILTSEGSLTNPTFVATLKQIRAKIQVAKVGQQLPIFDSHLAVLYPFSQGDGKNNDSIVLYGKLNHTNFLFTGDLESDGEASLLAQYPSLDVDILKAGHHGSKTSSSEPFVKAISPAIALISCGLDNRYHHPNAETLATFNKYGVKTLRTDELGAIKFTKNGKSWQISTVK